jgi:hypothetical protein
MTLGDAIAAVITRRDRSVMLRTSDPKPGDHDYDFWQEARIAAEELARAIVTDPEVRAALAERLHDGERITDPTDRAYCPLCLKEAVSLLDPKGGSDA